MSVDHPTEGRSFYHFDGLGSVTELSTAQSTILAQYSYDAWGNYRREIDNEANPFGFTGHEMDDESGLVYMKARFYDPEVGLFLSNDPVEGDPSNPPSLHRYLYAFQNPTVYVDPTGRVAEVAAVSEVLMDWSNNPEEFEQFLASYIGQERVDSMNLNRPLMAAIFDRAAGGVDIFNLFVNFAHIMRAADEGEMLPQDVAEELQRGVERLLELKHAFDSAMKIINEHPIEAATRLAAFGKEKAKDFYRLVMDADAGDEGALFTLQKFLYGTVLDVSLGLAGGSVSSFGSGARQGAGLFEDGLDAFVSSSRRRGSTAFPNEPGDLLGNNDARGSSDRTNQSKPRGRVSSDSPEQGEWVTVNEHMSERAAAFQSRVTGRPQGQAFLLDGVKFDGLDGDTLVDAKGPGYAAFTRDGAFQPFFTGADALVAQAYRQVSAADGTPIRWVVAEPEAAEAIENLLFEAGIFEIEVVHVSSN